MARLNIAQVKNHIEQQNQPKIEYRKIPYFSLKDDQDSAHVKMLINTAEDAYFYRVHTLNFSFVNPKGETKRFHVNVECLNDGAHKCPLCQEAFKYKKQQNAPVSFAKDAMYLPMYVLDKKEHGTVTEVNSLAIWTKGVNFYKSDLSAHSMHMPNLYSVATEIFRSGVAHSTDTSYRLYRADSDYNGNPIETTNDLEALKAKAKFTEDMIYGAPDSLVEVWTVAQMEEYITTGRKPRPVTTSKPENVPKAEEIEVPFTDSTDTNKPADEAVTPRARLGKFDF